MPKFQHRRTGRVVEPSGSQIDAYLADPRRWQLIDAEGYEPEDDEGQAVGEVPDGTIAEILAWAGNDEARKEAALYAERQGKARKTLIDQLT